MKIASLKIQNFLGVGEAHLSLTNKGLVLIQGENKDNPSAVSNGAGKSSIADALFYVFYGSTAREKMTADEVVNRTAKKNTLVEAVINESDGGSYTIKRWRKLAGAAKRSGCSISYTDPAGVETDLTKGTDALTQVEIDKALGCSEDVFTAAVYAGQEALPNLPMMGDTDLKKLIEEASGVTTLVKAHEVAKARLKDAERKQDSWRLDHVRLEREIVVVTDRVTDLKSKAKSYDDVRQAQVNQLKAELQDEVARAKLRRDAVNAIIVPNIEAKIAELDVTINGVHAENEEAQRLTVEVSLAHSRVQTAKNLLQSRTETARDLRTELDNINARVGTPCNSCGKPYEEHDLGAATDLAKKQLVEAVQNAREVQSDLQALEAAHKDAQAILERFNAKRTDVRATVEERRRLAELLAQRQRDDQAYQSSVKLAQRIKTDLDKKLAETNPYTGLLDGADRERREALESYDTSGREGAELEKRVMVLKDCVRLYGPAGVRAHIIDTVTPLLNTRTAEYLGILSDGQISATWNTLVPNAKGEMVEKFSITVETAGDAGSHAGLSGGEKRKVRLATALALQDLVASRATKPLSIWIGDEIDDALDTAGLERLMTILENKARERGTVVVISHNSLNDWIRETTTVTRQGGFSTVSGALVHV